MLKKSDPRVIRTRRFLREALMELVAEKGYENVSIQDITDRATLNRATFYLHYRDKDELLYDCARELFDNVGVQTAGPETLKLLFKPNPDNSTLFIPIFEHFAQHVDFYRAVLGENGVPAFAEIAQHYASTAMREALSLHMKPADPLLMDILVQFNVNGALGIISWWLQNEMPHSPEVMSRYFLAILSQSLLHFIQEVK